jgi:hypothetical protein
MGREPRLRVTGRQEHVGQAPTTSRGHRIEAQIAAPQTHGAHVHATRGARCLRAEAYAA